MVQVFRRFMRDEEAAVTVDWVVLTAAVVGLGATVVLMVARPTVAGSNSVGAFLGDYTITSTY